VKLAVKTLAEFVHRRGDLHVRLDGRARPEEGLAVQRALQKQRAPGYQRERAVSLHAELAGTAVTVGGRIDGCDVDAPVILVEEIKTTRADPERMHGHLGMVHWAQAKLYAGLLARELNDDRAFALVLIYAHPDTLATRTFHAELTAGDATAFLDATLADYDGWLRDQCAHQRARDAWLRGLTFPFPTFRPFQRAMAARAYRALRDREHLLLEAPTGSGKTAAVLFPALRALEGEGYRRILFLTSRGTGGLAVRDAVQRMDPGAGHLRLVTLTAREKACFLPGTPCEPDACPYARGYYDRARAAVVELLARRHLDLPTIAEVARAHTVCPFELSLDAASWCDLIVGDYNYLLDPMVRLQRFAADAQAAVLVDEAHQLTPRARDMLSLELDSGAVADAVAESPPEALGKRLRSLRRALAALRRRRGVGAETGTTEYVIDRPEPLLRSMNRLVETLATGEIALADFPACQAVAFTCHRWARSDGWYQPEAFLYTLTSSGRDVRVGLVCLDPGPYLQARFAEYGGHVRFSGTVTPLDLYARLHGEADAPVARAGNPFRPEQLEVLLVHDLPTYLRRREASLERLVDLLADVAAARPGHYLAAFPSFDYLNLAADRFAARYPDVAVSRQQPGMDEAERADWLAGFDAVGPPRLGFVVLGGVFGESVDFRGARLTGIVCVGVGVPPPSLTRQALAEYFDARGVDGRAVAFQQPAMVKVVQMAGRLLRGPDDRGVLCLVDDRFADPGYQRFFPQHWRPQPIRAADVAQRLRT
jgi:DNA excision repair protein ERCC-2